MAKAVTPVFTLARSVLLHKAQEYTFLLTPPITQERQRRPLCLFCVYASSAGDIALKKRPLLANCSQLLTCLTQSKAAFTFDCISSKRERFFLKHYPCTRRICANFSIEKRRTTANCPLALHKVRLHSHLTVFHLNYGVFAKALLPHLAHCNV